MFNLEGRVALVTGAAKGLGLAMAVALAKAGADIISIGLGDFTHLSDEVSKLGKKCACITADFSHEDDVIHSTKEALKIFNKVDILVNNAGVTIVEPTIGYSLDKYQKTMDINVKAVFLITQIIGEHMIDNKYGKIINIGSVQSLLGTYDNLVYVGSKHAVVGMTKCLGNDWGKYGINANAIAPGFMITDNTKKYRSIDHVVEEVKEKIPLKRWGNAEDLAGPVVFLASSASDYVNGHTLVVDGGFINL